MYATVGWSDGNGGLLATKRLGEELVARGHQVSVVSALNPGPNYKWFQVPGFYLPFIRKAFMKMKFPFGKGKKRILREAYRDADVIQIQFPFFLARNAVNVAKEMGVPVIGAFHVQPQNVIAAMGKESQILVRILTALFNFALFSRVDIIHCPSQFAADLLAGEGVNAHLRVISNGIPREFTRKEIERPDWFSGKFVIINIGRHAIEKRQDLLIEGVRRSKYKNNIQLLLCGRGETTETLKALSSDLPVKPFIGYVSDTDKVNYLNSADLYLHSSIIELESLTCLEAIGCGLPCLIGDSPLSAAPQFSLNDHLLFKMDNADDLAEKIDYWYENRQILQNLKPAVLQMAEKYRIETCISGMENLYEDVIQYYKSGRKIDVTEIQKTREISFYDDIPLDILSRTSR